MQAETHVARTGLAVAALVAVGAAALAVWILGSSDATAWSGPLVIAAVVLTVAGTAKVIDPTPAAEALRAIGAPASTAIVVAIGTAEVAIGGAATVVGGPLLAAAVAVAYVAFAIVAWRMSTAASISGCGCFGRGGARPGPTHIVVTAMAAAGAAGAAFAGAGGAVAIVADTPAAGLPALAGIAMAAVAVVVLLTTAAEALSLTRVDTAPSASSFHLVENP